MHPAHIERLLLGTRRSAARSSSGLLPQAFGMEVAAVPRRSHPPPAARRSPPRAPGSRCPKRRKRRPDPTARQPAAAHPGSAHAAPRTVGSAPTTPPDSGPPPALLGSCTGGSTATTTPHAASSWAPRLREPTSAGNPIPVSSRAPPSGAASAYRARVVARVTVRLGPRVAPVTVPPDSTFLGDQCYHPARFRRDHCSVRGNVQLYRCAASAQRSPFLWAPGFFP